MIPLQRPWMPPLDAVAPYFAMSREVGWYSNGGPCAKELTQRITSYCNASTVLVCNCTWGIVVALQAATTVFGTRTRKYVVCPSYTFVATASAIQSAGFTPLFVDADLASWQPSASAVREAVALYGDQIAAILGTSTCGTPCTIEELESWQNSARSIGAPLVIDSAAAFGGKDNTGATLGARGDVEIFSFHATKPFAIGEGGAITTTNQSIADLANRMINFGFDASRAVTSEGTNAKMSEIAAAFGLAVWVNFETMLSKRQKCATTLCDLLSESGFSFQTNSNLSTWQMLAVQTSSQEHRTEVEDRCVSNMIETRRYYGFGLHETDQYSTFPFIGEMANTRKLNDCALSLPMSATMTHLEIAAVAEAATGIPLSAETLEQFSDLFNNHHTSVQKEVV